MQELRQLLLMCVAWRGRRGNSGVWLRPPGQMLTHSKVRGAAGWPWGPGRFRKAVPVTQSRPEGALTLQPAADRALGSLGAAAFPSGLVFLCVTSIPTYKRKR